MVKNLRSSLGIKGCHPVKRIDLTTFIIYSLQLENEKCGCNSKCFYQPGETSIPILEQILVEKLPCKFYITVTHTQALLADIRFRRVVESQE